MDMDETENEGDAWKKSQVENGCNNVDSLNLDEADLDALRGDIVGDTVYSGKWILKTLIALSKIHEDEWSESLEGDLCTLWDMTAEKDVVQFLTENDFLRIAECTLKISEEPRLTEIILGIIGNMCCQPTTLHVVADLDDLISIIFGLLSTDDTETLLQVIRLLQSFVWDIHKNPSTKCLRHLKDCQFLGDSLSFILQSSTNDDLLVATVELLQSISNVELPDESCLLTDLVKPDQLVPALVESFNQFIPKDDAIHSRADLKFIEDWLTIFTNTMQSQWQIFRGESHDDDITKIMQVILKILKPYVNYSNLFPLDERLAICIHDCVEMASWLQKNKNRTCSRIFCAVLTIGHEVRLALKEDASTDEKMDMDEAKDLVKYLETYCLETLRLLEDAEVLEMYQLCGRDVIAGLIDAAKEHCKERPAEVDKLLHVQSLCPDR